MHHRRFSRELRRAVAHEDEESAYGRSVLQGEGEDLVDQLPENELPGHALDQPKGRRKTRRLAHGCVASARAMPHVRAPAEPITGRPERVLERRPPARSARAWGGGRGNPETFMRLDKDNRTLPNRVDGCTFSRCFSVAAREREALGASNSSHGVSTRATGRPSHPATSSASAPPWAASATSISMFSSLRCRRIPRRLPCGNLVRSRHPVN